MRRPASQIRQWGWCLFIILLVACAREPEVTSPPTMTPYPADLYIGLSDTAAPAGDLVRAAYEDATGNPAPIFLDGNDEALRDDLQQGALEAAILHYLPADSQFWFTPIALDGVVIMVHPGLPIDELTSGQLRGIVDGSITNWSEIGGPDLAINLLVREPGSGPRDVLSQRIMANALPSGLARIAASDSYMQQEILANPGSIGYTMMGNARSETLSLDGRRATKETVTDQSYPLTTPIYIVTPAEPGGPLRDFLAWVQSPAGQAVLGEKYGRVR